MLRMCASLFITLKVLVFHWKEFLFTPFIPEFRKWTVLSLNLVRTIVQNRGHSQKLKHNDKQCKFRLDGSL